MGSTFVSSTGTISSPRLSSQKPSCQSERGTSNALSYYHGRIVEQQIPKSAKIQFERIYLAKDQAATKDLRGSIALTEDTKHVGWLHMIIFICQLINAFFTGQDRKNINLCHGEVILGVNEKKGKEGQLLLAHSICPGIKTSSEDHQKDEVITGVVIYRPTDEKMRTLIAQFAEQTAANFQKEGLDPKAKDFKVKAKKLVPEFSIYDGITTIFYRQVIKPIASVQRELAYVAADLLKGDKLRDENGDLAAYYCTAYTVALLQGTALIAALTEQEKLKLKGQSRDAIAQHILNRIQANERGDQLAATYRENDVMRYDARHTMTYKAGDLLDNASQQKA